MQGAPQSQVLRAYWALRGYSIHKSEKMFKKK